MTRREKWVWEGVIDPAMGRNIGWRDLVKDTYQGAVDEQCYAMAKKWVDAWVKCEGLKPSAGGLQFPKRKGEKMEEQEKQKQEETDRYFAWLGAKHALRAVNAELGMADVRLAVARLQLEEAKREIKAAEEQHTKAVRAVEGARAVVALLEPKKS